MLLSVAVTCFRTARMIAQMPPTNRTLPPSAPRIESMVFVTAFLSYATGIMSMNESATMLKALAAETLTEKTAAVLKFM